MDNIQKEKILKELLIDKYSVIIDSSQYDISFFDPSIGLLARNVVDLIFNLEETFNSIIAKEQYLNKSICSFNGLLKAFSNI